MTVCAAGGGPIAGEVCWVDVADGPPVPMCAAHFQADDCGRHLMDEFGGDERVAAILDGLMRLPCPGSLADHAQVPEPDDDLAADLQKFAPFVVGVKP